VKKSKQISTNRRWTDSC